MTLILSNNDVEKLLTMRECIEVLEDVYVELSEGRGVNRVRSDCLVPCGRGDALYSLKSMDGVIPKLGIGAVRVDSDIVTWPKQGNTIRRVKVPAAANGRYVGLVLLFSSETGEPLAILPDGVMQRIRVAPPTVSESRISRARMQGRSASSARAGKPARSSRPFVPCARSRSSAASVPILIIARRLQKP
jgi:alanine dehydrogenase